MRQRCDRRGGFSLVELLVVIGIIAILIALLLPTLQKMREQAYSVKCLANLHNIGQAASAHVNDHAGYLPTGGWQWNCVGGVCNPHGLEDDAEKKYMYYNDAGIKRPLPLITALAFYMNVPFRTDTREHLAEDLGGENMRRPFHCPAQFIDYAGGTERDENGTWTAPDCWSSYDFNTALLGRRDYNTESCPRGLLVRVRETSRVYIALDGRPRNQFALRYFMIPDRSENDTLYDVQQDLIGGDGAEALDFGRHRSRINVLFCDFHAQNLSMGLAPSGGDGLKEIYESRGIAYP
jgi:prepilin-type N-terminal cleavage/methylation domain-containing protein/prepilin-type processing-associated H-X9-DG protein